MRDMSLEANLTLAKRAVERMQAAWNRFYTTKEPMKKLDANREYAAAFLSCKVFIENYLKHRYPDENLPNRVRDDIRKLVTDMEAIDKANKELLQRIFKDIDQLGQDAA
jgi:hypothetical protein